MLNFQFLSFFVGLLALTTGPGDKSQEILEESISPISEALKSRSETSKMSSVCILMDNICFEFELKCFAVKSDCYLWTPMLIPVIRVSGNHHFCWC